MFNNPFRCGDRVYDVIDPRHVGTIVLMESDLWATIRWQDKHPKLESVLPIRHLRFAEKRKERDGDSRI